MGYQDYIEHLSITLPGTMPMSYEDWERAQHEKAIDSALILMRKFHYSLTDALNSCGLEGDEFDAVQAELMRRWQED